MFGLLDIKEIPFWVVVFVIVFVGVVLLVVVVTEVLRQLFGTCKVEDGVEPSILNDVLHCWEPPLAWKPKRIRKPLDGCPCPQAN